MVYSIKHHTATFFFFTLLYSIDLRLYPSYCLVYTTSSTSEGNNRHSFRGFSEPRSLYCTSNHRESIEVTLSHHLSDDCVLSATIIYTDTSFLCWLSAKFLSSKSESAGDLRSAIQFHCSFGTGRCTALLEYSRSF